MIPRATTGTVGYQTSLGVTYGMYCCGVCSRSSLLARYTDGFVFSIRRMSAGIFGGKSS